MIFAPSGTGFPPVSGRRPTLAAIIALLTLCVALPTLADGEAKQGHLVIVGGALDPDNEPIYRAVLDRLGDDGTLGVLPTASGVPEESGPNHVADFQRYAGPNQKIVLLDIRAGDVDKANDPAWVEKIRDCNGLWFTGGVQSRIVDTFRPDEGDTPAYAAMWDILQAGGVIGGTSAGAAMMSDPMILWGNSHEALLLGVVNDVEDMGVGVGKGMGFLPKGLLVDQHFFARGRLGRLLVAMVHTGFGRGLGIGENTAVIIDLSTRATRVLGQSGVLMVGKQDTMAFHSGLQLPTNFHAGLWRDGFDITKHGPGAPANEFASAPDVDFVRNAISGAPRTYDGPLWMDPVAGEMDDKWPVMRLFKLEGMQGLVHDSGNSVPHRLRAEANAVLEANRKERVETESP